jgi:competence protein ComEC
MEERVRRPLAWCGVALLGGIAAAILWHPPLPALALALLAVLFVLPLALLHTAARSWAVLGLVACTGASLYLAATAPPAPDDAASLAGREATLEGLVVAVRDHGRFVLAVERAPEFPQIRRGRLEVRSARSPAVEVGDRVRVRGTVRPLPEPRNPGDPRPAQRAGRSRIGGLLFADSVEVTSRGAGLPVLRHAARAREALRRVYHAALPPPYGAVLSALVLGTEVEDEALERAFRDAGLAHVLVASGAQLAIVAAALYFLLRRTRPWVRGSATLVGILAFALLSGWEPSMARALVMATVVVGATLLRREADPVTAFALAAVVLLVTNPLLVEDVGWQLSFAATWGLIALAPPLSKRLGGLPRRVRDLLSATIGAQAAVLPFLLWHFGRTSLLTLPTNLLALPAVGVLVPLGLVLGLLGAVWAPLAWPLVPFAELLCGFVVLVAQAAASLPGAVLVLPAPPWWAIPASFLALGVGVRALGGVRPAVWIVLLAAGCTAWQGLSAPPDRLRVTFLDVGQGDSIVVRTPRGRTMVIDGGPDGWATVRFLRHEGVGRIDLLVLSHPHADHVGGLLPLLENFAVGGVLDVGYPHPTPPYRTFLAALSTRGIPCHRARRGVEVTLDDALSARVLWPQAQFIAGRSGVNENSIVLRLVHREIAFLFPGDVEENAEAALVSSGEVLRADVLKVPHQGSRTSSTEPFLRKVRPHIAVLSVGRPNPFGHPHPRTLRRYERLGVRVYRTDWDGAVTVASDGRTLWVQTMRRR